MFVELHANTYTGLCQYLLGRTLWEASIHTEMHGLNHVGLGPNFSDHIYLDKKNLGLTHGVEMACLICFMS